MCGKGRYLLNIDTGKIHDGQNLCFQSKRMAVENQKWSDSFDELVNFYEGEKRGTPCNICLRNKRKHE